MEENIPIPDYLKPAKIMPKFFGTLDYHEDTNEEYWVVKGAPQMTAMVKRLFPASKARDSGTATFPFSKRLIGDLNWFMQRYPLEIKCKEKWEQVMTEAHQHYVKNQMMLKKPQKERPSHRFIGQLKEFQKEGLAFLSHNPRTLLADEMGLGKSLYIDSKILIPGGWKRIGDVQTGDEVIGANGTPTIVIGVYPQGIRKLYRVTFNDGSSVLADKEHLWAVNNRNRHRGEPSLLLTTQEMSDLKKYKEHKGNGRNAEKTYKTKTYYKEPCGNNKWQIPIVEPIIFNDNKQICIEPYLLGCLLGDGSLVRTLKFTTSDDEILHNLKKLLPNGVCFKKTKSKKYDYNIVKIKSKKTNILKNFLRELGAYGKTAEAKFIPDAYRYSTVENRLALLQGLMDTDGCPVDDGCGTEYCTVSKRLALDVQELVETLGGIARFKIKKNPKYTYKGEKKNGRTAYRLNVKLPIGMVPFRLQRKLDKYHIPSKYKVARYIKDIRYEKDGEAVCISVSAPDGLYVTDHCIVTHNTVVSLAWLDKLPVGPPYMIVVPPHLRLQWSREINKFLGSNSIHLIKGLKPYPLPRADFYIIHYLLLRGWKTALRDYDFNACIFDEIQELRRSESEKYSAASILSTDISNVIGLSGTPFYNFGGEMWNILNIIEFKCLGDYGSFSREWCYGYMGAQIEDPKLFGEFLRGEGLFIRRTKEDVMSELPPKYRIVQAIDVDNEKYDELIQPVIKMACEIPELKEAFKRGTQTWHAIDQTRRITGLAKAKHVASFTKTLLEAEQPTVLYAHHHDVMDILTDELRKYNPVMISGRQNTTQKDLSQKIFMDGDTDLIIISLRSGLGLNLQRGKCVVFGELDWSPAVHSQAEDRCHRMGLKNMVLCYYLICNEGTDQAILDTLGVKTSQFVNIMGDRVETEDDKLTAQREIKNHMAEVIEKLQHHGGTKKPEPSPEVKEKIEYLQKTTKKRSEPRSLDDFADGSRFNDDMYNDEDLL